MKKRREDDGGRIEGDRVDRGVQARSAQQRNNRREEDESRIDGDRKERGVEEGRGEESRGEQRRGQV